MVEFKVGDKVRIHYGGIHNQEWLWKHIGKIATVRKVRVGYLMVEETDIDPLDSGIWFDNLEPAEEEPSLEERVAKLEAELKENKSATGYLEQRIFKLEDNKIFAPEDGEPTKEPKRKAAEFTFGAIIRLRNDTTTYFVKTAEGWSYSRDAYLYDDEDVDNRVIAEVIREGI